jgi:hypothetical protein
MTRKATDQVTTIGIDISKNGFHLINLDGRQGWCVANAPTMKGGAMLYER